MSYYSQGLAVAVKSSSPSRYRQGLVVGGGGIGDTGILADIYGEMSEIDGEMKSLDLEIFKQLRLIPSSIPGQQTIDTAGSLGRFYISIWRPFAEEWQAYRDRKSSLGSALLQSLSIFATREVWKDLQEYRKRLGAMFAKAKEAGFQLQGPEPTEPKKDIVTQAINKAEGSISAVWSLIKIVVYVGLAIVGGAVIFYIVKQLRG